MCQTIFPCFGQGDGYGDHTCRNMYPAISISTCRHSCLKLRRWILFGLQRYTIINNPVWKHLFEFIVPWQKCSRNMARYFPWRRGPGALRPLNKLYKQLTNNSAMGQWYFGSEGDEWPMKPVQNGLNWLNLTCTHEDMWFQGCATWPFFPTVRFVDKNCSPTKVLSGKVLAHISFFQIRTSAVCPR